MNQTNIQIIAARVRGLAKELLAIASQLEAQAPHLAVNLPRDLFSDLYAAAAERPEMGESTAVRQTVEEVPAQEVETPKTRHYARNPKRMTECLLVDTAERDGTVATTCPLGTVYNEPCFGIAQTVEVTRQTHDITLTGIARCYALVLDRSTTYAYRIHTGNIIDALAIFPDGDIATVFVKPTTGGTAGIVAIGTGGDEKEYNVSWLTTTGGTHLDTGCWYCFPGPATKVGTTLAVTHGTWTAGTIAN